MFKTIRKNIDVLFKILYNIFYVDQWCIVIKRVDNDEVKILKPSLNRFWADPMMIKKGQNYYLFIEELEYSNNKGYLSVIRLDRTGMHVEKNDHDILPQSYHLSYPHVFKHEDEYYMMPESNRNRSIDLYKAVRFPDQWILVKTLFSDIIASDSTLFFYKDRWWLFTTLRDDTKGLNSMNNLHVFSSIDLLKGDWVSHPKNPVVKNTYNARSAGPIFVKQGKIIRPSQNCKKRYGHAVVMNEITTLSMDEYEEKTVAEIFPDLPHQIGLHSYVECDDLIVTDGLFSRRKFLNWPINKSSII